MLKTAEQTEYENYYLWKQRIANTWERWWRIRTNLGLGCERGSKPTRERSWPQKRPLCAWSPCYLWHCQCRTDHPPQRTPHYHRYGRQKKSSRDFVDRDLNQSTSIEWKKWKEKKKKKEVVMMVPKGKLLIELLAGTPLELRHADRQDIHKGSVP